MSTLTIWLDTEFGKLAATALLSMVPVVELRGGIPFGILQGLNPWAAYAASVLGNMVPVPLILVYSRAVFLWARHRFPALGHLLDKLEHRAHLKGRVVLKYRYWGLFLFVAIPLPGTGGWTGALAAAFLNMRLRNAAPSILLGLMTAGLLVLFLTHSVTILV